MKKLVYMFVGFFSSLVLAVGDAGCGLGSMVISKNSKVLQLFALTTNNTLFTQPLGITSGTSNCSSSGIVKNDKEIQYYVEVNQNEITRQMAQGSGSELNTLASLYGCQTSEARLEFNHVSKKNFADIVTKSTLKASELIANLDLAVKNSDILKSSCVGI